jgi:diguanylate cyclase (GGDEF)-like protein
MQSKNRHFLITLALIFIFGELLIGYFAYHKSISYANIQNQRHLDELLMRQRALHTYVEETLKPVFYELKAKGKLYEEFFDPRGLSFTYIARRIHANLVDLDEKEKDKALFKDGQLYYKLATDNPRNELNRATAKEEKILNQFRQGKMKKYSEMIEENGHKYIYHAIPIAANKESCMQCHSTPDRAPKEMIEQYGAVKGFGEEVGNIRAMISLKVPFDHELNEAMWLFKTLMTFLTVFLILLYGVVFFFVRQLDKQGQIIQSYNRTLEEEVEHDGLTGVYNRRSFDARLHRVIGDETLVLCIIDIDFFKKINDTYGHQAGDNVLVELAKLMSSNMRDNDRFYRIGGEEFAIISTTQNLQAMRILLDRLYAMIGEHEFVIPEKITISAGIAAYKAGENSDDLYKCADDALYRAKSSGRSRYVISD